MHSLATNLAPGGDDSGSFGVWDVFLRDTVENRTIDLLAPRIGPANGPSHFNSAAALPEMSGDGRHVQFFGEFGGNFTSDEHEATEGVYVRDIESGITRLI